MGKALGIVYRAISTHIAKKSGHTKTSAHTGAVTLIQRFGSALNLNVHLHMLFLDGVFNLENSVEREKDVQVIDVNKEATKKRTTLLVRSSFLAF